jgi:hypothetical protein
VASKDDISPIVLRRAVIYGSVMASFNVEGFSLNRMRSLSVDEIKERYTEFQHISHFEHPA